MLRNLFSLFPAYAGVIPMEHIYYGIWDTFPRIRGGDPLRCDMDNFHSLFSPHTRG